MPNPFSHFSHKSPHQIEEQYFSQLMVNIRTGFSSESFNQEELVSILNIDHGLCAGVSLYWLGLLSQGKTNAKERVGLIKCENGARIALNLQMMLRRKTIRTAKAGRRVSRFITGNKALISGVKFDCAFGFDPFSRFPYSFLNLRNGFYNVEFNASEGSGHTCAAFVCRPYVLFFEPNAGELLINLDIATFPKQVKDFLAMYEQGTFTEYSWVHAIT